MNLQTALSAGLALGAILTGVGLLHEGQPKELPGTTVAVVNGEPLSLQLYHRLLDGLAADREGTPITDEDRRHVLNRMVEEELLVQQAIAMGMASKDRMARGYLVQAMIDFLTQQNRAAEVDEATLRTFYEENRDQFSLPGKIALRMMQFDVLPRADEAPVMARVTAARNALVSGGAWSEIARAWADEPVLKLPATPLGASKVLEYLGPTATRAAFRLEPGHISEPIRVTTGYLLLEVTERWDDTYAPFDSVRDEVKLAYERRLAEVGLRDYLADLKGQASIELREVTEQAP